MHSSIHKDGTDKAAPPLDVTDKAAPPLDVTDIAAPPLLDVQKNVHYIIYFLVVFVGLPERNFCLALRVPTHKDTL